MVALMLYRYLPPTTKLGQGNIFRSVCQEFCPWGGGVVVSQHALQVSRPTPREKLRGLAWGVSRPTPRGVSRPTPGGVSQHAPRQTPHPADGYCCGRYASYWNAFLFVDKSKQLKNYFKSIAEHKDVTKLVMMLSSSVNSFRESAGKALKQYSMYYFLWEEDRDEYVKVCNNILFLNIVICTVPQCNYLVHQNELRTFYELRETFLHIDRNLSKQIQYSQNLKLRSAVLKNMSYKLMILNNLLSMEQLRWIQVWKSIILAYQIGKWLDWNGLFTLAETDSEMDSKPNGYIVLCRTFHIA